MARNNSTSMFDRLQFGSSPSADNEQSVEGQQEEEEMVDVDGMPPYTLPPPPPPPTFAVAQQPAVDITQQQLPPNQCPDCREFFKNHRGMRIHAAIHNEQTPKSPHKRARSTSRPALQPRRSGRTPTPSTRTGFACSVCSKVLVLKRSWKVHEERCRQQVRVRMNTIGISPNATTPAAGPSARPTAAGHFGQIAIGTAHHHPCPPAISPNNLNMSLAALINQQSVTPRLDALDQPPCSSSAQSSYLQQWRRLGARIHPIQQHPASSQTPQPCNSAHSFQQQVNWAPSHQIQQHPEAGAGTPTTINSGADDDEEIMEVKPLGLQHQLRKTQWAVDLARQACASGMAVQVTADRRGKLVVNIAGSTESNAPAAAQNQPAAEHRQGHANHEQGSARAILIKNLPRDFTLQMVGDRCQQFGNIEALEFVAPGEAKVRFVQLMDAERAKNALQGNIVEHHVISVECERTTPAVPQNQPAVEPRQEAGILRRTGMKMEQN